MPQSESPRPSSLRRRLRRRFKRWQPEILYSYVFPTSGVSAGEVAPGYTLVEARPDSIRQMRGRFPRRLSKAKADLMVRRLTDAGQHCWLIRDPDGELAGYCHMSTSDTVNKRINHRVSLTSQQGYVYDDYVFPSYRGRGLHTFAIARRCELAAGWGRTELLTTITKTNIASLRSFEKFGAKRVESLVYLPVLGRTVRVRRHR